MSNRGLKVVIFSDTYPDKVELEINKWLNDISNIEITKILQSESGSPNWHNFTVTIFYHPVN